MFSGVGGFELGIVRATKGKWRCVGYSEIDKFSNQVMRKKFKGVKNYGDAKKINTDELPDFDFLCGGFPCQAFSIAGKREGFKDIRGTMFFEIARILKTKRPKMFLLENVKGLLNHEKGKTFTTIIQTLSELGYNVQWVVLNSKFFGVPQNRERVFLIGSLRGECRPEVLPFRENAGKIQEGTNKEIKGYNTADSKPSIGQAMRKYGINGVSPPLNNWAPIVSPTITTENAHGYGNNVTVRQTEAIERCYKLHRAKEIREHKGSCCLSQAMRTGSNNVPMVQAGTLRKGEWGSGIKYNVSFTLDQSCGRDLIPYGLRRLTPTECCRLQGFPDDWNELGIDERGNEVKISDTQRYKQMGNAVTVNVIKSIIEQLMKKNEKV